MERCQRFIQKTVLYTVRLCFANDIIYAYENILNKDNQALLYNRQYKFMKRSI